VSNSFQPGSAAQRTAVVLRDILETYFNDSELRDLCFELHIDYENLPGAGKASKARELVSYCERHGRTRDLAEACCRARPLTCDGLRALLVSDQPGGGAPAPSQLALTPIQPLLEPASLPDSKRKPVPLAAILAGICGVIVIAIALTVLTSSTFSYPVRVQALATGDGIGNAKVTIELPGLAPINAYTDSNGFTSVMLVSTQIGKRAKIIAEAVGYQRYAQEIDVVRGTLPNTIRMRLTP
jgi:hypothetical protein